MPDTRLVITEKAAALSLLSLQELRAAAGVTDATQDASLLKAGERVAAKIVSACQIAVGVGAPATLRRETLTETFWDACTEHLILSRRHEVEMVSVTIDGVSVELADVVVDSEAGLIALRRNGQRYIWRGSEIVAVYKAGFSVVPEELKSAAMELVRWERADEKRDPYAKATSFELPGVISRRVDQWVGAIPGGTDGPLPSSVAAQLRRFMNG